jgi:ribosomal protein S18 acetylase RimI-like enzyme
LSLSRDWRQVLAVIEVAFGEALDAEARRALRSMRLPVILAPYLGLMDSLAPPGEGMMPGFVWIEGGRVVGTASVRRVDALRRGWLISNVAVYPDWQGRGIGRTLMEASLDFVQDHGGAWAVLQVRDDNLVARQLYESLGFQKTGEVIRLRKIGIAEETERAPAGRLFPARWSDGKALFRLARSLMPYDMLWADTLNQGLYQTGLWSRVVARLQGRRCRWWVEDAPRQALKAAVGVEVDPRNPWHRLRLLVLREVQDEQLASSLIAFGLMQLADDRPLPVEIEHLASDKMTLSALREAGFEPIYALAHMRLDFRS